MEEWTTAQIALVVSGLSFALALANFIWSVWSKFIFPKPRLEVRASFVLFEESMQRIHYFPSKRGNLKRLDNCDLTLPAISVYVANHGPGSVKIGMPIFERRKPFHARIEGYGTFTECISYPWQTMNDSDRAELKDVLNFGDNRTFYVPVGESEIKEWMLTKVGFIDALGRKHFCSRADIENIADVARRHFSHVKS